MITMKVGTRIGIALSSDKNEVRFLGWGVYEGMHVPPGVKVPSFDEILADSTVNKPAGLSDAQLRERYDTLMSSPMGDLLYKKPRLRLDNGKEVWGHECWWGDEPGMRKHLRGKRLVLVDIDVARADAAAFKAMVAEGRKAANA